MRNCLLDQEQRPLDVEVHNLVKRSLGCALQQAHGHHPGCITVRIKENYPKGTCDLPLGITTSILPKFSTVAATIFSMPSRLPASACTASARSAPILETTSSADCRSER